MIKMTREQRELVDILCATMREGDEASGRAKSLAADLRTVKSNKIWNTQLVLLKEAKAERDKMKADEIVLFEELRQTILKKKG